MITLKKLSSQPCFICKGNKAVECKFADKTFAGVLCMDCVFQKVTEKEEKKESKKTTQERGAN